MQSEKGIDFYLTYDILLGLILFQAGKCNKITNMHTYIQTSKHCVLFFWLYIYIYFMFKPFLFMFLLFQLLIFYYSF